MTVKQAQCLLLYLGYSPGSPDGVVGPQNLRGDLRSLKLFLNKKLLMKSLRLKNIDFKIIF